MNNENNPQQQLSPGIENQEPNQEEMTAAYKASSWYVKKKLKERAPELSKALEEVREADVIVVDGTYDHAHLVLELGGIPFVRVNPEDVENLELRSDQTVFVNCPGHVPDRGLRKLRVFVEEGGLLITTDWALVHVLEKAFPGKVRYNGKATQDDVVRITVLDKENPLLDGFLEKGVDPLWWLEGSSYPIIVEDRENVKVLIESKELEEKYGESPVIVEFTVGGGRVVHMISHFYLQRTETRDKKDKVSAAESFMEELAAAPEEIQKEAEKISTASFKSAQTSLEFISKNIAAQKRKSMEEK